jgi:hypothetical protein
VTLLSLRGVGDSVSLPRISLLPLLILAVVFVGSIAFVGISGDFPLNDDWSFAITTRRLADAHTWAPVGWASMTLITNALWALPICIASSCGFVDLRLATMLAALLLFSATYFLAGFNSKRAYIPLAAALLVAFNPIAYALSFTFMTDILFTALVAISASLFIVSLERDSDGLALLGALVALAATMSRQLGLCLPLAYMVARLLQEGDWRRKSIMALAPLILCGASLMLFNGWLRETGKAPMLYGAPSAAMMTVLKSPVTQMISRVGWNLITALLYLGLFSLPMLLLTRRPDFVAKAPSWPRWVPTAAASGVAAMAGVGLLAMHRTMPIVGNILVPQGIGPLLLRDAEILHLQNVPPLPSAFWIPVTLLSIYGMFELTARGAIYAVNTVLTRRFGRFEPGEAGVLFAATAILAYYAPLLLLPAVFDRYNLPVLPITLFFLASVSAAGSISRFRIFASLVLCLLIAIFSVLGAHDYMAWNRARWTAIADLQNAGIATPANLDGGLEYNGYFSYNPSGERREGKSWWWIDKDDYQITFGPIAGMRIFKTYPYETLLPPATRAIQVLTAVSDQSRPR